MCSPSSSLCTVIFLSFFISLFCSRISSLLNITISSTSLIWFGEPWVVFLNIYIIFYFLKKLCILEVLPIITVASSHTPAEESSFVKLNHINQDLYRYIYVAHFLSRHYIYLKKIKTPNRKLSRLVHWIIHLMRPWWSKAW